MLSLFAQSVVPFIACAAQVKHMAWSLVFGASLGGNATVFGAAANVVVVKLCEKSGINITLKVRLHMRMRMLCPRPRPTFNVRGCARVRADVLQGRICGCAHQSRSRHHVAAPSFGILRPGIAAALSNGPLQLPAN